MPRYKISGDSKATGPRRHPHHDQFLLPPARSGRHGRPAGGTAM